MIRSRLPDIIKARSIVDAAQRDMAFVMTLPLTVEAGPTIIRGIYENFRSLGDAILVANGVETADHIEMIKELLSLPVKAPRPLGTLESLRRLRHDINYRGYSPTMLEIEDARSVSLSLFQSVLNEVRRKLDQIMDKPIG